LNQDLAARANRAAIDHSRQKCESRPRGRLFGVW